MNELPPDLPHATTPQLLEAFVILGAVGIAILVLLIVMVLWKKD